MTDIVGSALGSLASNALGNLFGNATSTVGVQNTAPLVFNAARQAGSQAATNVENRYGTLGLGDSTMSSVDASAARGFPFVSAANSIAGLDLNAQEFNAKAAQQYQNQMQQLDTELQSFLGGQAGAQPGAAPLNPSAFTPGA
jgi:hypothetical protein